MVMATMVVGNEEGNGKGRKSDGDGNEGCWLATLTRAIGKRVAGK